MAKFNNAKMNHVTLTNDLAIKGQTSFNLTIHNKTCNYDAKLILVSISTFSRSGISEKLNKSLDFES